MARLSIPDEATVATFTVTTSTAAFPISFSLFAKADLRVSIDGAELTQSDFSFSGTLLDGGGYDGGTVTLNDAVDDVEVKIWRSVRAIRASNFAPSNFAPVGAVDQAFNRLTAIAQDHDYRLSQMDPEIAQDAAAVASAQRALAEAAAAAAAADRVQTGLDRVATGEDADTTAADAVATAADRVQTGLDRQATADDVLSVGDAATDAISDIEDAAAALFKDDTTEGIADTVDGEWFKTVEDGRIVTYKNVSEVAVEKSVAPKKADVDAVQDSLDLEIGFLSPLTGTDVTGRAATPSTGTAINAGTFVFVDPLAHDGLLRRVRVFGLGSGTFQTKVFGGTVGSMTQVGIDRDCTVTAGAQTVTFDPPISVQAGQWLGFYTPGSLLTYTGVTADGAGWYNQNGNLSTVTDTSAAATPRLEVGFDVDYVYLDRTEYEAAQSANAANSAAIDNLRSDFIVGTDGDPIEGLDAAAQTFVFADALPFAGQIASLKLTSNAAGTVKIKRFQGDVGSLVRVGTDTSVSAFGTGLEEFAFSPPIEVAAGDRLGLYGSVTGAMVYTLNDGTSGGVLEASGDANTATDITPAAARLEAQFTVRYVDAIGPKLDRVDTSTRLLYGTSKPLLIVCDGNSETEGDPPVTVDTAHPKVLADTLNCRVLSFGVSGQTIEQMIHDAPTQIHTLRAAYPNHFIILTPQEFYNQIVAGSTVDQAIDWMEQYCEEAAPYVDAIGVWNLGDMLGAMSALTRAALNTALDLRWADFADFLIDCRLDSRLMDSSDTTYWQGDRVHTNVAGQALKARLLRRSIRDWMMDL